MKTLIVALLLAVGSAALAQTVLPPGTYIVLGNPTATATPMPPPTATATAIPTAVPTAAAGNFISNSFALLYCSSPTQVNCIQLHPGQDDSQYTWWSVQPFDSNGYPTTIAYVDVMQDGVRLPNITVIGAPHTWIYRVGGQSTGRLFSSGVTKLPVPAGTKPGTMQVLYNAFDDNGHLVQSWPTIITLR